VRLKPNLLAGGYGQFTYYFNYWGPVAVNRDTHVIIKKMTEGGLLIKGANMN